MEVLCTPDIERLDQLAKETGRAKTSFYGGKGRVSY
jgi:predicted DNA-binding protein